MKKVHSIEELSKVLTDTIEITTPVVSGEAGIGKSVFIERYAKDMEYEIYIPKRMSGITDEIFVGIPEKVGDHFEFLKMGFIQQIIDNPDKKVLLFLDEINRTPERLRPVLFSLLEKVIDDVHYPNLDIVCAVNLGEDFSLNWDLEEDKALFSRMMLIDFKPSRKDFFDYAEDRKYNEKMLNVLARVDNLYDSTMSDTSEYEQTTNYRSWYKLDHILNKNNATEIEDVSKVIHDYGRSIMNKASYISVCDAVESMIRLQKAVNIREVISKEKLPNENQFDVLMAVKDFSLDSNNEFFIKNNIHKAVKLMLKKKDIFIDFIQRAKKIELVNNAMLKDIIKYLDKDTKGVLIQLL